MVNCDHIKNRITEIDASLAVASISMDDSKAAQDALRRMDFSGPTFDGDKFTALCGLAKPWQDTQEKESLQATLDADLMVGNSRYIISNEKHLVSPAGFHPDTKVYLKTDFAVHRNDITHERHWHHNGQPVYIHKMPDADTKDHHGNLI